MKINMILIVTFLIFALTLTSVSAADLNATSDEITAIDNVSDTIDSGNFIDCKNSEEVLAISDEDILSAFEIKIGDDGIAYIDDIADISIEFPKNVKINSKYYFYIDNKLYKKETIDYEGYYDIFPLKNVACGEHTYKLVYKNNKNTEITKTGRFKVDWSNFELEHYYGKDNSENIKTLYYGDIYRNSITLPEDARGNVKVIVNNKTEYSFGVSDFNNMVISDLPIGRNEIVFEYSDRLYSSKKAKDIVNVIAAVKGPKTLSCVESAVFTLKLPKDANGTLVAHYPNHRTKVNLVNGYAKIKLPLQSAGKHKIYIWYNGTDYDVKPFGTLKYVDGIPLFGDLIFGAEVSIPDEMTVGENKYLRFELPKDANGILEINYDEIPLINGSASISLSNLEAGEYTFDVSYTEDSKYANLEKEFTLIVNNKIPSFNITMPSEIIANTDTKFTFNGPDDCNGWLNIYCEDEIVSGEINNGKLTIKGKVPKKYGNQSLYFVFESDGIYSDSRGFINFISIPTPTIQTKDYYLITYNGKTYNHKVRILDGYGKPVGAGEKVKIYTYPHKLVKTVKTDSKGYITLKFNKPVFKDYSFEYKGVEKSSIIDFSSATWLYINGHHYDQTVKKSAKAIKVEVHLREPFNYKKTKFSNKKVTVKFNGKTYKLTTKLWGIAKLTIKQKDIKKLKVGKKYKMAASYAKDTKSSNGYLYIKIIK